MPAEITRLLGCRVPVVQAPIGGASSVELAAAVANAGGVGSLALTWRRPDEVKAMVRAFRAESDGPLNANFVLAFPVEDQLNAALEEGAPIISFFWGDPAPVIPTVREAGAVSIVAAGSVDEAKRAAELGASVIVAQGREAGGHVRGELGLMTLLPAVIEAVRTLPVLAAGGIVEARGSAAARALGASGIWAGTRFLASAESSAHPSYKDLICQSRPGGTLLSELFDGGWPDAPARTLINSTAAEWERSGRLPSGSRPGEGEIIGSNGERLVHRYHSNSPTRQTSGEIEAMALYAGEGSALIDEVLPAATLVRMLADPWLDDPASA